MNRRKEEMDALKIEEQNAERRGDLERVAEIRYGKLIEVQQQMTELSGQLAEKQKTGQMLKEEVDEEDVALVVSKWTGIPVSKMLEGDVERLIRMEEELAHRVVGQDQALRAVSDTIRRARAGIQDESRPLGSFLFLGPTGVGKTELARALAEFLFDDERAMVRLDMSEYMEKHSVSRLIGAPPGYVGHEEGGQLTEAVKRRPFSIILLDEIEKAHSEVFNILLQVLDDGRLTDGKGRTVDFKNTLVIMTSNLGSQLIKELRQDYDRMEREVRAILESQFRPEFLNRVDEVIFFRALSRDVILEILDIQVRELRNRLKSRKIDIEINDAARKKLAERGYDPVYGARPQIGRAEGDKVLVDLDDKGGYRFRAKR
jgi:ATP-dependent Clp protease ATP-binding subunit ClpB